MYIPFVKIYLTGNEKQNISQTSSLSGDGFFTRQCHAWLEQNLRCNKALLTPSCTAALEMAALLMNLNSGDEIIMPSYTFPSTANAFALRGAIPVFVDIRPDTLNLNETLIESAITAKTRAIVLVHYAGVACEMDTIIKIAKKYELYVIEDGAQAILAKYKGRYLGTLGDLGTYSFHETKNITCGEGGALLINNPHFIDRAEIIREKGTNRSSFYRGEIDKYTWQHLGSSYLPSELNSAFLFAQLEAAEYITERRLNYWNIYHEGFADMEDSGLIRRPIIPAECEHNAHIYYLLVTDVDKRDKVLAHLKQKGIMAVFHYIPLHQSPAGKLFARAHGELINTESISKRILRLPLFVDMNENMLQFIVETTKEALLN